MEEDRYRQALWFSQARKRHATHEDILTLADGRNTRITQLFQFKTYSDLLMGTPTEASNRRLIERFLEYTRDKITGATRPHLIRPRVENYPPNLG